MKTKHLLIGAAIVAGLAYFFLKRKRTVAVTAPKPIILPGFEPTPTPKTVSGLLGMGFLSSNQDIEAATRWSDVETAADAF